MKKIYLLTKACLFTAAMFMVSACTEDDAVVTPIFPEGETVETVAPGTEYTLTFSANMDWRLESSRLWCVFSDNEKTNLIGEMGDVTVSLKITKELLTVDDDIAEITLIMGDEKKVIAKYTRTGSPLEVISNDAELNEINFEYSALKISKTINFRANFDWEISETPEWLIVENLPIKGKANSDASVKIEVNPKYLSNSLSDKLLIKRQNTEEYYEISVTAEGIGEGNIRVVGLDRDYGWKLSADGKLFSVGNATYNVPFTFYVVSKNNDYKIISIYEANNYLWVANEGYKFYDVKEIENVAKEVTIDDVKENEGKARRGIIMILPNDKYEEAVKKGQDSGMGLDGAILNDSGDDINDDYSEYVKMVFTQDESEILAGGFEVKRMMMQTLDCSLENEGSDVSNFINETYKIDRKKIYTVTTWSDSYITVNPKLSADEWNDSNMKSNMKAIYMDDTTDVDISSWEPSMSQDETNYVVSFMLSNRPMVILFKNNSSSSFEKALILNVEE